MSITYSKITEKQPKRPPKHARYRRSQLNKGLVRFELQVSIATKQRFDQLVQSISLNYPEIEDERRRLAKARNVVFEQLTNGALPTFSALIEQIKNLKAEINALLPTFFKQESTHTPLPEAIQALPDDPQQLKRTIVHLHQESQQAKKACAQYQRQAEQFEQLYDAVNRYNDELLKKAPY